MKENKITVKKETDNLDFVKLWKENQSKLYEDEESKIKKNMLSMAKKIEEMEKKIKELVHRIFNN